MEDKEVFESIAKIIKPYVRNEEAYKNINENTKFIEDLNINSTRLVDTVLKFEDEFDISIDDEEIESLSTLGIAVKLIQSKKS